MKIKKEDRWSFLIMSFLQPFCYFIGESFGINYVSSTIAALIISTIPVFTPFVGYFLLKEKLSLLNFIGITLSTLGVFTMVFADEIDFSASMTGILLLFFAVFSAVVYGFYLKKVAHKYSPLSIIAYQNLFGLIYFLPLFLVFEFDHFVSVTPDVKLLTNLFYLAVFGSTLAYVFFTYALRHLGLTRTNVFTNTIPVFTAIFSFIVLDEEFSFLKIFGMLIVMSGLFLSQFQKSKK